MRCMRGCIPASRVQFKSLGGCGGPLLVSSAILRDRTESQGGLQYHTRPSCGTGGAIQALRVPLKSLGGRMGSYGGLRSPVPRKRLYRYLQILRVLLHGH